MAFLALTVLLVVAMAGHVLARKLRQSDVLGELVAGVVAGALAYQLGGPMVTILRHSSEVVAVTRTALQGDADMQAAVRAGLAESRLSPQEQARVQAVVANPLFPRYLLVAGIIHFFSSFGVVLLLFTAGLESSVDQLRTAGRTVAGLGFAEVGLTFASCYAVAWLLVPQVQGPSASIVVAGALSATSVGISVRCFRDMDRLGLPEAQVVMGSAVLDDVLSLVILAVVTGLVTTGVVDVSSIAMIVAKAVGFFAAVYWFGTRYLERAIALGASVYQSHVTPLYLSFGLLLVLAWLADVMGLATIIGAFTAGLILDDRFFRFDVRFRNGGQSVESVLAPLQQLFAPMFFVLLGFQVDVWTFADLGVLALGGLLTVVAIFGKMAATVTLGRSYDRLVVGFGLVPRGEVTLIFASLGKAAGILSTSLYSVLIIVVFLTTLVTPPLLKWAVERRDRQPKLRDARAFP